MKPPDHRQPKLSGPYRVILILVFVTVPFLDRLDWPTRTLQRQALWFLAGALLLSLVARRWPSRRAEGHQLQVWMPSILVLGAALTLVQDRLGDAAAGASWTVVGAELAAIVGAFYLIRRRAARFRHFDQALDDTDP